MKVGFIGLGKMGSGMARNLLRAGHRVTLYNRSRDKADAVAAGAEGGNTAVANSPAKAVWDVEAVFTMLADDAAVEEVVFGDAGIAGSLPAGAVHVSSSTISTRLAKRLAVQHGQRDQRYVSAPVFGRPEAAEAKRLLVVAAGSQQDVDRCRPLFDAIGRQTFLAGVEAWQANAAKLCGNFMIASMIESFGEANALLRKAKVDPHVFLEVMNALFGSPVYANYGGMIANARFEPAGFALKLGLKDLRLVLETALDLAAPMPVASVIRDQFLSAMSNGQADQDWSSVVRSAARAAGL